MGTLFSSFDIARSGLQVAQIQLDTAGHNIANVNKEGFSRQRVELLTRAPIIKPFGLIGRGVHVARIVRLRDQFLDDLFRNQVPGLAEAEFRAASFSRIEDLFLEPSENGIGGRINNFFDSLNDFSTNVESLAVRQSVLNEASAIVALFRETAQRLFDLRTNANDEARNFVPEINSLTERIALLNVQVRDTEISGQPANDLRDARDVLLDELARLVNIFTRERDDGQVDVLVSGEVLVDSDRTRVLEAVAVAALDPERNDLIEVRFVDNGMVLNAQEGELAAAFIVRDQDLVTVDTRLDTLAATIIEQINLIHSQANGLANITSTTSANPVTSSATPLDLAGLPFTVSAGTFDVDIFDSAGNLVSSVTVTVTPGTSTLATIAAAIGGAATITGGDTLVLSPPGAGDTLILSNDTSGLLGALGLNTLFTGFDARTIGVNAEIANNPALLASAFSSDLLATGDNTAALDMADVRVGLFLDGNTSSINDFYEATIVSIGIETRSNEGRLQVERTFVDNFERRRQAVFGVSIDEEITFLLQFQRAFEASARVITVADRMLEALLGIAR